MPAKLIIWPLFAVIFLDSSLLSSEQPLDAVLDEIRTFSKLSDISEEALIADTVLGTRVPMHSSHIRMGVETCYFVEQNPNRVIQRIKLNDFDAKEHSGGSFGVDRYYPVSHPAKLSDFNSLKEETTTSTLPWFLGGGADQIDLNRLNLSQEEASMLSKTESVSTTWRQILHNRARDFQEGGLTNADPYVRAGEAYHLRKELINMLGSRMEAAKYFAPVLDPIMTGKRTSSLERPYYYWFPSQIQGQKTLALSAFFSKQLSGNQWLASDMTYYSSASFYNSLGLYRLWPVQLKGKKGTLVWRGEYVITRSVTGLRGIERIAAENVMLLEVMNNVRGFIKRTN